MTANPQGDLSHMPPEIMGEVFRAYMDIPIPPELDNVSECSSSDNNVLSGPYVLCMVCTYWRALAVKLPVLWSQVTIYTQWNSGLGKLVVRRNHGRAIQKWLNRIGRHPWSLNLYSMDSKVGVKAPSTGLLDILPPTLIESLEFLCAPAFAFDGPGRLGTVSFPMLKSLAINSDQINRPTLSKLVSPKLRKLVLSTASEPNFPPQLTHLYIGAQANVDVGGLVSVMTKGVCLQRLYIWTYPPGAMSSRLLERVPNSEVHLASSLVDLTLINAFPFSTPFPAISWPNLKRLRLLDDTGRTVAWHHSNLRLLQPLTQLHLSAHHLSLTPALIFDVCSHLTQLTIDSLDVADRYATFFHLLAYDSTAQIVALPCLRSLKLDCLDGLNEFPYELFQGMVASRLAPQSSSDDANPGVVIPRTPLKELTIRAYLEPGAFKSFKRKIEGDLAEFTRPSGTTGIGGQDHRCLVLSVVKSRSSRFYNYERQMVDADVDHWDRGFGDFLERLGEF